MNPLPRILAMALLVVLAALLAVLVVPAWTRAQRETAAASRPTSPEAARPASNDAATHVASPVAAPTNTPKITSLPQRTALSLAAVACTLTIVLLFSLAVRPSPAASSTPPFESSRSDMSALTRLAETSAAQGIELSRERDVRRRAEEDAQLKQQLLAQSLQEKIRIGRDLHDGIIQSLYAVGLTLESVRVLVPTDPAEANRRLERTRSAINDTIRDVRAYITGLAPENLRRAGFAQALESLLIELQAGRDTRFDVKIDDEAAALLTSDQSLQALQIAREAVSNALRHGGASLVTVRVHKSERELCLLIQDNGVGFDAAARRDGGHGLDNLHARAASLGATLRITSQSGEGTRVIATLPILQPAAV
ncbi:MAG: sensor histidine kinase [Verrucomicrobiota bacterium]